MLANTCTYIYATPTNFEVPDDTVNSTTLEIAGYWINDNNDEVAISGTAVGTLVEGGVYINTTQCNLLNYNLSCPIRTNLSL